MVTACWHWLNVYGNREPHGDVSITGSREALEALARQIQKALAKNKDEATAIDDYFDSHGEGYSLMVMEKEENSMMEPEYRVRVR